MLLTTNKRKKNMSNKKALIIGINYEGTTSELRGCQNDAFDIQSLLKSKFGFQEKNINVLVEKDGYTPPTRANILSHLSSLIRNSKRGDKLFFHYSGHGSYTRDRNGDELDGKDECLIPLDYEKNGIILDDDLKNIVRYVAAGATMTAILDCCHSGTGFDLRYNYKFGIRRRYTRHNGRGRYTLSRELTPYVNRRDKFTRGQVFMFSGCRDDQYSADTFEDGKYVGAMTWGFIKIVENGDVGKLSYYDVLDKLRTLLKSNGYSQLPQLSSGRRFYTRVEKFKI